VDYNVILEGWEIPRRILMNSIGSFPMRLLVAPLLVLLAGCGPAYYKDSADSEVYGIIRQKSEAIKGMPSEFTIDSGEAPALATAHTESASGGRISLAEAIETAVKNSRSYQSRKEQLYSQGLSLTSSRHSFAPRFSGSASGDMSEGDSRKNVSGALSLGVSKMLATGADLSVSIATNLFRYISGGDPGETATSAFAAALTQPLLRGAGREVALENLTQAERSMVYAIRDFVRYRKSFSVDVAQSYFNLLQQGDQLLNAENNFHSLQRERIKAELMANAGRVPEFQVDQRRQSEQSARDSWIRAQQRYENSLDRFKLDLGLPTDVAIEPDPAELEQLAAEIAQPIEMASGEAIEIALTHRLDLSSDVDRYEDSERRVRVAANQLKPGLDLILSYGADTDPNKQVLDFAEGDSSYSVGADLDLPFDRKSERNSYRQALINREAAQRNLEEQRDQIKLEVRDALRNLQQARQSYEIQENNLRLNERRVESTTLLQQAGRANTRDVLDAQEDLLDAQNGVTQALVDHFNARLDLLLALEALKVDDNGLWMIETSPAQSEESR